MAEKRSRRLFGSKQEPDTIKPGAQFMRKRDDQTIETAEVRGIYLDPLGIPHVRYNLQIANPGKVQKVFLEGPRVLSLSAFAEHFHEQIAAAAPVAA
jgi:hypothetical protein